MIRSTMHWPALACCVAVWLALSAPGMLAQPSSRPSTQGRPDASTPAPPPSAQAAPASAGEALRPAPSLGQAESAVVDWVLDHSGPLHGDSRVGNFRVAFTVTPAEGWWDKSGGGTLAWHEPPANHVHLRIFVLDRADGRLLPGLSLGVTLLDAHGNQQAAPVDFGWYPLINAYGGNIPLAADGSYTLRVVITADDSSAPRARLPLPEERLTRTTTVEFPPVAIAQDEISKLPLATAAAWASEAELLKPGNEALSAAITALWRRSTSGREKPAGDYFVAYALDGSAQTGLRVKNLLEFSARDHVQLEVLVRDSRSGRMLAGLRPRADLVAADGTLLGPGELAPLWHPPLAPYGRDLRIPRKGVYRLRISFDAPGFRRWGRQSERFASPAGIEFEDLSLKPEAVKPEGKTNP